VFVFKHNTYTYISCCKRNNNNSMGNGTHIGKNAPTIWISRKSLDMLKNNKVIIRIPIPKPYPYAFRSLAMSLSLPSLSSRFHAPIRTYDIIANKISTKVVCVCIAAVVVVVGAPSHGNRAKNKNEKSNNVKNVRAQGNVAQKSQRLCGLCRVRVSLCMCVCLCVCVQGGNIMRKQQQKGHEKERCAGRH